MLLCIDIGNTNITFGLFEGNKLGPSWRPGLFIPTHQVIIFIKQPVPLLLVMGNPI